VLWPVTQPDRPLDNAALEVATAVLRDRELSTLRDKLGATYTPSASFIRNAIQRDFTFVALGNTFESHRAEELAMISIEIGVQLAAKGVTPEEFTRVRELVRAQRAKELLGNDWWLDYVALAQSRAGALDEMRSHGKVMDAVTMEDVNQAAQNFQPSRLTAMILHPVLDAAKEGRAPESKPP